MPVAPLDPDAVRGRFTALQRTAGGRPYAFFDGPGGSQVPDAVAAAVADVLIHRNANLGGPFETSVLAGAVVDDAREAAADLVGGAPDEIALGPNMTTLNFLLAHAVARTLDPGDEVVTTELDHDANVSPWLRVAEDHGLVVRQARLRPEDGTLDLEHLEGLLGGRTRIVAFTLASNLLGTVTPAERIVAAAHAVGALAWADSVHFAPHRRVDRVALGADVLLSSPYKWFGPHLGVASIRHDLAAAWPSDRVRPADQEPAGHRFETGTASHEGLAGMIAAVDYIASLGEGESRRARLDDAYARIRAHEDALAVRFLEGLAGLPHLRLLGIPEPARVGERVATFAMRLETMAVDEASRRLAEQGLAVPSGNFYALSATTALGVEETGGALRAGFLHYTTADEVDRLLDALSALG